MGILAGPVLQPWAIARVLHKHGWTDLQNLTTMVAVVLAESAGYTQAYNDNLDSSGNVKSRDVGLCQINIPASKIGTADEEALYDPDTNVAAARKLYEARGFQPWVAFNSGVALDPQTGGHYIERAVRGVANWAAFDLFHIPNNPSSSPMLFYAKGAHNYPGGASGGS
jgi:hypothetical protein